MCISYSGMAMMLMVAVVEPMTSTAHLKLNMKPEQSGFIMPKILLDVVFGEILVALAKSQVSVFTVYTGLVLRSIFVIHVAYEIAETYQLRTVSCAFVLSVLCMIS